MWSRASTASPVIAGVGNTDQRSQIETYNISPTYTRVVSNNSVFNLGAFVRKDFYHYYPSDNPLADRGPANLQTSSIAQGRTLMNAGAHSDLSYDRGKHAFKFGALYSQTFLRENDSLGVVHPMYSSSAPCVDGNGNPLAGYSDPVQCAAGGAAANPNYLPVLAPYDFTRGGGYYLYQGRADIKELGLYIQDQIKAGNWTFNVGIRGDLYNGLTAASQPNPGSAFRITSSRPVR